MVSLLYGHIRSSMTTTKNAQEENVELEPWTVYIRDDPGMIINNN